jgi:hypothetical protein
MRCCETFLFDIFTFPESSQNHLSYRLGFKNTSSINPQRKTQGRQCAAALTPDPKHKGSPTATLQSIRHIHLHLLQKFWSTLPTLYTYNKQCHYTHVPRSD